MYTKRATRCFSPLSSGLLAHPSSLRSPVVAPIACDRGHQIRIPHALLHLEVFRQGEQIRSNPLTPVDPIIHSNVTLNNCCGRAGHIMVVSRLALLGVRLLKEPRLDNGAGFVASEVQVDHLWAMSFHRVICI
ncbi:hypothetical protein ZIOFF_023300 [Zingiber officinale]|uniref:Uncharacterized protein n=1 Tax=Zingiber officinale TaxID=94328 RepID=A0A8J5H2T4_ZINOF|nr:hypothetical protein ZIOFF_023300 [Zingiber officinale]